ncbi:hypothetical protein ACSR0Z_25485 [Streptomyces viridosporus]
MQELLALGLTVEDPRGIADRLHLLVDDPQRRCAHAGTVSPAHGVVERRPSVLDSGIDRLSRLRARLTQRAGRAQAGPGAHRCAAPRRPASALSGRGRPDRSGCALRSVRLRVAGPGSSRLTAFV